MFDCHPARWLGFAAIAVFGFGCSSSSISDTPETGPGSPPVINKPVPKVDEQPLIAVTPRAATAIAQVTENLRKDGQAGPLYLRYRVLPGGCTGVMHKLDLDTVAVSSRDHICESGGIKIVVWQSQVEMLRGSEVDYGEKDGRTGFMLKNPNLDGEAAKKWLPGLEASVPESERAKSEVAPLGERISQFRKMTADDPENELAHFRLGQLLMEDGRYMEAVKSFERALELSPQFSKVYELLGECHIRLVQKARAVEVLTKGWTTADQNGDEIHRESMAKLLAGLAAPVPKR